MTKGKYANRAANHRAATAAEQLAELRERYTADQAAWKAERQALRTEADQLRGRLIHEVDAIAREQVRAAEQATVEAVAAEREAARQRVLTALLLWARIAGHQMPFMPEGPAAVDLAEAFGVNLMDITRAILGVDVADEKRIHRRTTNRTARTALAKSQ